MMISRAIGTTKNLVEQQKNAKAPKKLRITSYLGTFKHSELPNWIASCFAIVKNYQAQLAS